MNRFPNRCWARIQSISRAPEKMVGSGVLIFAKEKKKKNDQHPAHLLGISAGVPIQEGTCASHKIAQHGKCKGRSLSLDEADAFRETRLCSAVRLQPKAYSVGLLMFRVKAKTLSVHGNRRNEWSPETFSRASTFSWSCSGLHGRLRLILPRSAEGSNCQQAHRTFQCGRLTATLQSV